MPSGKTGNEWSSDDFSSGDSPLVKIGAPEFIDFCISRKSCELTGDVLKKFKDIIRRFATDDEEDDFDDEDYDPQSQFAVLVRERLVEAGLLPKDDADRYQYKLTMGFIHYAE